jgi:hypothetical protein
VDGGAAVAAAVGVGVGAETSAWLAFAGPRLPSDTHPDPDTATYARFTSAELAAAELAPALGTTVG